MDVDVQTYLPGDLLAKVDITTMACSLEARSPFLDHHVMEWAAGLPGRLEGPVADHEVPAQAGDAALATERSRHPAEAGFRRPDRLLAAHRTPRSVPGTC